MITSFQDLLSAVGHALGTIIPLLGGIALLVFLWGLAKFIFKAGDEKAIENGRKLMIWGIVGLFVMFSVWGIITLLQDDLVGNGASVPVNIKYKPLNGTDNPNPADCTDGCGY